jgi:hypothetical protein
VAVSRTAIINASVAELVDALDSKSCTFGCAGSIPARGTKKITAETCSLPLFFCPDSLSHSEIVFKISRYFQSEKQNENELDLVRFSLSYHQLF